MASFSTILAVSSSTHLKSSPLFELKAPGTFSHTMNRGLRSRISSFAPRTRNCLIHSFLNSFTILICSINNPERVVSSSPLSECFNPALFPATLKSWQGLPPVIISTNGTSDPFIFVISPKCFTPLNSFLLPLILRESQLLSYIPLL